MKRCFTRQEAIEFLNCNPKAMPIRIVEDLSKHGFKNIEKIGRGDKLKFICEQPDETNEQCYYIFKDILINEYNYRKSFDYDLALDIINFHINNTEYVTLEEIVKKIGTSITPATITNHRRKLSRQVKNGIATYGIVKSTEKCDKIAYAKECNSEVVKDITDIYETVILNSFRIQLTKLMNVEKRIDIYATIYAKYSIQDYKILINTKDSRESHDELCSRLRDEGYKHCGTFMVWWNLIGNKDKPRLNDYLYNTLFTVNLKCHGFDFIFYKRLYTITKELEHDEEFLDIIKRAIEFKNATIDDNKS